MLDNIKLVQSKFEDKLISQFDRVQGTINKRVKKVHERFDG